MAYRYNEKSGIELKLQELMEDIAVQHIANYKDPKFLEDAKKLCDYIEYNYGENRNTIITRGNIAIINKKLQAAIVHFEKAYPHIANTDMELILVNRLVVLNNDVRDYKSAAEYVMMYFSIDEIKKKNYKTLVEKEKREREEIIEKKNKEIAEIIEKEKREREEKVIKQDMDTLQEKKYFLILTEEKKNDVERLRIIQKDIDTIDDIMEGLKRFERIARGACEKNEHKKALSAYQEYLELKEKIGRSYSLSS